MHIEFWPIQKVVPYAGNPRQIPAAAVDKVKASIQAFGWRQTIVVDKNGVIIAGHTRLLAAQQLGLAEVPVHVAEGLSPAQVRAFRLMDNRSHEESSWNLPLLGAEMLQLKPLDIELALTGFEPRQIDCLLGLSGNLSEEQANAVPPLPAEAVSRPGDLWSCGPHRVLCGDSTQPEQVGRLLAGQTPRIMVTDPPYGVAYQPEWRTQAGLGRQRQRGVVVNDHQSDWRAAYQLFRGDVAYVWHAGVHAAEVREGLVAAEFEIRAQIIWAKQHFALSRGHYHWQHEPCWYAVRQGRPAHWRGDRTQSTLWPVANLNSFGGNRQETPTGHGTQKPVELMRRPLLNHTEPGELVYDPFLGSGTTLMAAALLERVCYGVEIDPRYVDVITLRWEQLLRQPAHLVGDGRSFRQIQGEGRKMDGEEEAHAETSL